MAKYDVADQNAVMPGVDVRVSGANDAAGNAQADSTSANVFGIDTRTATVASVAPSVTTISDANVGSQAFSLTVAYNEAMDTSVNPTIAFPTAGEDPAAPPATLSFHSGSWTDGTTYVATYDVADQNAVMPTVDVQVSGGQDTSGNAQATFTAADRFSIDTQNPTVVSFAPSVGTISDANVGSQGFSLTVVFGEAMDTSQDLTFTFPTPGKDPTQPPATLTFHSGSWTSPSTYVATYDVANQNVAMSVDVRMSGAKDLAGNAFAASTVADAFSIDTQNPTLISFTRSVETISDANVGSDGFSLTMTFSEAMDTSQALTISFPTSGEDPTQPPATLTFHTGSWTSATTYAATYDVANQNAAMSVDVGASGAKDTAGNAFAGSTLAEAFSIDTQNPTVASVTPSAATISDANVGSQKFTLTVVYSQAMDTSVNPTIAFPTAGEDPTASPATLTFDSGSWTNGTTYVATYDVADANLAMPAIDVQVSGGKDAAGNAQVSDTAADNFSVDTQNPTVTSLTPNLTTIVDANVGSLKFTLTVVYSQAMKVAQTPTISFPTAGEDPTASPATLTLVSQDWTNDTTFVATYNVADQNLSMPSIDVQVSGGQDAAGNAQATFTPADVFSINTVNPTVASVTPSVTTIGDANVGNQPFTLTVVYSQAMDTSQNPTIAFPTSGEDPTALPATLTFTSGNWTNSTTYVASYTVADQNMLMPAIDVQVSGGKDAAGNVQASSTAADVLQRRDGDSDRDERHPQRVDDQRRQRGDADLRTDRGL